MFGDVETIQRAKAELVEALGPEGTAVLNADDPRVLEMHERTTGCVLTYGRDPQVELEGVVREVDITATNVRLDRLARARFQARTPWGSVDVELPLAGDQFVGNALAALAVAGELGVEIEAAGQAIAGASVSSWRGAVEEVAGVVILNDAYNANPLSVRAALRTLTAIDRPEDARTWAVLGVMAELGPGAEDEHRAVGESAQELGVDRVIAVGEGTEAVLDGAAGAGADDRGLWQVGDADGALELIQGQVRSGDVVLLKGSRVAGLEAVAEGLADHLDPPRRDRGAAT
jgi:UDP-N-acetylmuramoyl-tripeptide--D-alanyl-D-alanine ligase